MKTTHAIALALLVVGSPLAAQSPPMPDHPELREAFLAWDRGEYPAALRGYLGVLNGPDGAAHLEEIALLTGELHPVREVAVDGSSVQISPDGRVGSYQVVAGGRVTTHVVDLTSGAVMATLEGGGVVLGPDGRHAYFVVEVTDEVRGARAAATAARRARDFPAMARAQARLVWAEAQARTLFAGRDGTVDAVALEGLALLDVAYAGGSGDLLVLAAPPGDPDATDVYRVGPEGVEAIGTDSGAKAGLLVSADGRTFVFAVEDGLVAHGIGRWVVRLRGGASASLGGAGGTLRVAFLSVSGDTTRVQTAPLSHRSEVGMPRTLFETTDPVANPVVSPDGRHVAFQSMPFDDWELFVAPAEGGDVRQLSLEIQHDRNPRWVGSEHVLAAKGEGRHMRSYVYGLDGAVTKLFHNNTLRTIAPEYDWAVSPDGSRVLLVSERDGDTVSPERGVYLVDRTALVSRDDVRVRLERALAAEEDLRRRGREAFAAVANRARAVTDAISVGRIYQSARDVYAFGSKHIAQPGNALAIEYYERLLRSYGYEPEMQWFEPRPGLRSANLIVTIPGTVNPELVYVASSHFDSVERGPGADDNSSGATALLEVARVLRDHPMPATIEIALFTGEEAGLLGSREYVRRAVASGKRVVGALNNDMVGWANDHRLDNTIRYSNPGIRDIQHAAAMQFSRLITYDALYYKSTDAAAYYEAYGDIVGGIGSYPVLGNPHYHQVHDRLETISQQLVTEVAKATAATLVLLASSPARSNGLMIEGRTARWQPAPETGVRGYEVRWETDSGWAETTVETPMAELAGLRPDGRVMVRATHQRGTVGWDWARAQAAR